jgi:hypothetical protein
MIRRSKKYSTVRTPSAADSSDHETIMESLSLGGGVVIRAGVQVR